jgi:hypothetical protein
MLVPELTSILCGELRGYSARSGDFKFIFSGILLVCWCLGVSYVFGSVIFSATRRIYCYVYVYSVIVECSLDYFHNVSVCWNYTAIMFKKSEIHLVIQDFNQILQVFFPMTQRPQVARSFSIPRLHDYIQTHHTR